ncbi:hypothetical protein FNL55_07640 [Tardiphaga sp. vice352]|uniref:hypothetical protein n=1 Tax=unclassified Tardiphaga TaxID=2631404 RepID=UPI00116397B2|nr:MULTISPECIES: hypothetical protein [unclassified Tardiphaga]QDM15839.1 hypothetical protein FNL53_07925 [Tardiphaga sp. vice278]QDM20940.1 hypothetical protein FIU28_07290 [Tardiphaga sp. vice154]QDM26033.1 hypothetical protein FNL56_07975 [Tardiphaga sp. vice304]QDM31182.1 hypothetical protein FNL55_07640 [Tardiphaga sp. vice352]
MIKPAHYFIGDLAKECCMSHVAAATRRRISRRRKDDVAGLLALEASVISVTPSLAILQASLVTAAEHRPDHRDGAPR